MGRRVEKEREQESETGRGNKRKEELSQGWMYDRAGATSSGCWHLGCDRAIGDTPRRVFFSREGCVVVLSVRVFRNNKGKLPKRRSMLLFMTGYAVQAVGFNGLRSGETGGGVTRSSS